MTANPRKRAIWDGDMSVCAGKPYRPSNGTEGEIFDGMWCDHCERDRRYRENWTDDNMPDAEDGCPILADTLIFNTADAEYPKQWRYDESGVPECSGFVEAQSGENPE